MNKVRVILGVGVVLCQVRIKASVAAPQPRIAVIESVVSQDTSDVSLYLQEVVRGLGSPPARSGASLGADIESRFGRAPVKLSAGMVNELAVRLKNSERTLFFSSMNQANTKTRQAFDDLEDIRKQLENAQSTLAHSTEARDLYYNVLLKLARAYQLIDTSKSKALAEARMQDVVRYFRDRPLDPTRSPKELYDLFLHAREVLSSSAVVHVSVNRGGVKVCLNGFCTDSLTVTAAPGKYQLFIATAQGDGRIHELVLDKGETRLQVDVPFEVALRTDAFVGFSFENAAQREKSQPFFSRKLGMALGVDEVVTLASLVHEERAHVGLTAYSTSIGNVITAVATPGDAGVVPPLQMRRVAERLTLEREAASGRGTRPTAEEDRAAKLSIVVAATYNPLSFNSVTPRRALIVPTRSSRILNHKIAGELAVAMGERLQSARYTLANARSLSPAELQCDTEACLAALAKKYNVDIAVRTSLLGDEQNRTSYRVIVRVALPGSPPVARTEERSCANCSAAAARDLLAATLTEAIADAENARAAEVTVEKPAVVSVSTKPKRASDRWHRPFFLTLGSVGVAGFVGSAIALGFEVHRYHQSACTQALPPGESCPFVLNTTPGIITSAVVGVGSAALAITSFVLAHRTNRPLQAWLAPWVGNLAGASVGGTF